MFMIHGEISHLASREPQGDGSSSVVVYLYLSDRTLLSRPPSELGRELYFRLTICPGATG